MLAWFIAFESMIIIGMLVAIIWPWTIMWHHGIDPIRRIFTACGIGVIIMLSGFAGVLAIIFTM